MTILNRFTNNSVKTLVDAATIVLDAEDAPHYQVTITANRTLGNPSNPAFAKEMWIAVSQDAVGGHILAFASDWIAVDPTVTINPAPNSVSSLHATARNFGSGIKWYYSIDSNTTTMSVTLAGDVTGASGANTVVSIRNASVPPLTNGILTSTSGALSWAAVTGGTGTSVTYPTSAALSAKTGAVDNELAITQGSVSPNDTGVGGRWFRVLQDNMLNVRWFGAVGDGVADDTIPIQKALDACTSRTGGVYIPRGDYRITSSLMCGWRVEVPPPADPGTFVGNDILSIRVMGESQSFPLDPGTFITWDGAATDTPAIWFSGYGFRFEGLAVRCKAGRTLHSAFELGNFTSTNKFSSSSGWFRCAVQGGAPGGTITRGFSLGSRNGYVTNLENCLFDQCTTIGVARGLEIGSGQPYNTALNCCTFSNTGSPPSGFGVYITGTGGTGSMSIYNTDFQNLDSGIFITGQSMILFVSGGECENCKKLLYSVHGFVDGVPHAMTLKGMRISPANAGIATANFGASDTIMIFCNSGSSIIIEGVTFDGEFASPMVLVKKSQSIVSSGCCWPSSNPFAITTDFGPACAGIWSSGDKYVSSAAPSGSQTITLPSRSGGINLSGLVTIAGSATSADVVFPVSEMAADYHLSLDLESAVTPAIGSTSTWSTNKTPTGFTVNVAAAPGAGNSVTFRYTTWR
jgi:hypothetical protein